MSEMKLRKTNKEFIEYLTNGCGLKEMYGNPLTQVFIISALEQYTRAVLAQPLQEVDGRQLIDQKTWKEVAAYFEAEFKKQYKNVKAEEEADSE